MDPVIEIRGGLFDDNRLEEFLARLGVRSQFIGEQVTQLGVELVTADADIKRLQRELDRCSDLIRYLDDLRATKSESSEAGMMAQGSIDPNVLEERMEVALTLQKGKEAHLALAYDVKKESIRRMKKYRTKQHEVEKLRQTARGLKVRTPTT